MLFITQLKAANVTEVESAKISLAELRRRPPPYDQREEGPILCGIPRSGAGLRHDDVWGTRLSSLIVFGKRNAFRKACPGFAGGT
jgi:hypothetical protein